MVNVLLFPREERVPQMTILIGFFTIVLVLLSLFLVLVVLMQRPKADSGLGAAIGGGGAAESAFGAETSNVLMRTTIVCAVLFFVLTFVLYLGNMFVIHRDVDAVRALPDIPGEEKPAMAPPAEEELAEPDPEAEPADIPPPSPGVDLEEQPPADP